MKVVLPRQILLPPAELALKSLQAWCFSSEIFGSTSFRQSLDSERKVLLRICQDLRREGYSSAEMDLLSENSLLDEHTKRISDMLQDDIILKLALLTCIFDFRTFIGSPNGNFAKSFIGPILDPPEFVQGKADTERLM
ncbi:hypothetical protein CBS147347_10325 [Aspergillus niger]|nr:hypothetical protein CBS147347_10325 [Aspergillus niger]